MTAKLEHLRERYQELTEAISQPDVLSDIGKYRACLKEQAEIRPIVDTYEQYLRTENEIKQTEQMLSDPELHDMAESELETLASEKSKIFNKLKLLLVPPDPMDDRNVVMEIRAGAGGDEAALFAGDILRMYLKFSDRQHLSASILSVSETGLGGINEALVLFCGPQAYALLKFESGVHCVKRVPVTESSGRIHTSTVTVAVMPEAEEVEVSIDPDDLRIDVFHSSGKGGQGVNTSNSAVRITHIPTNTVVQCQDERSQLENKAKAMRVLRSRLLDKQAAEHKSTTDAERKCQIGSGDRSERVRTYYFNHDYVVDHRIGMTVHRTSDFLDGNMTSLIDALRLAEKTQKLSSLHDS